MTAQELKNSILQLAIQGKLVEQRPDEGTAEELYRQIQSEKDKLLKAGKIKKEKPLPEITEDEIPFEIPETWKWVRLRMITYNRGQCTPEHTFSYIDIGSIDNKKQKLSATENLIEANKAPSRARKIVEIGDILYSTVRPYLHNTCIVDKKFSATPIASTGFAVLTCYPGIYNKYLFSYLISPTFDNYANNAENSKGVAYPAINDNRLYRAIIPLPPLEEQKRIVAKIEEIFPYIERFGELRSQLRSISEDLRKSILQQAIQGKLVEQRPEEGTAEELYRQIQSEKAKLLKSGKIKKEKPLPPITEEEIPFEIPKNWVWARFADLAETIGDGIHGTPVFDPNGDYYFINGSNLINGKIVFKDSTQKVSKMEYELYKKPLNGNTVLLSINGSIGNIADYNNEPVILGKSACYIALSRNVNKKYITLLLGTKLFLDYAVSKATKTTIANVSLKAMRMFPVPLPPLAEQQRIVAKIEELLPLCDKLK